MALPTPRPDILVYIAGPYTASTQEGIDANIARAVDVAIAVAELGCYPVCPHANTANPKFGRVRSYQFWLDATAEMLRRCDAALFVPGFESSFGARSELLEAKRRSIPVFFDVESLAAHVANLAVT